MKLLITYLCELCQKPIAYEKMRTSYQDDAFIQYDEKKQFCERCGEEMKKYEARGWPPPTIWWPDMERKEKDE